MAKFENKKMKKNIFCKNNGKMLATSLLLMSSIFSYNAIAADIAVPVTTDSRIKTLVYNENEVFNIVTHYGYQSNIEFGAQEEIDAISLGDRVPFQVIPSGRRLFIRAQTVNARTNMTVITNKRTYQFDIASVPAPVMPNEELVYVVKFFYPDDKKNAAASVSLPDVKAAVAFDNSGNLISNNQSANANSYNYKYTFSGNDVIAPLKVFDDGKSTFFKLPSSGEAGQPSFYIVNAAGAETKVYPQISGEYYVVSSVAERFVIEKGQYSVSIYNENMHK
ncbi:MAG: TrbG/VirB9 family P-type conjugative transfer protein [Pseudomonadota bacterium]